MQSAAEVKIAEGFQKFRLANAEHEGLSSYTKKCNEYENSGNLMGLGATGEINKQVKRLKEKLELSRGMHTTGAALMLTLSRSANSMGEAFSKMQMADSSLLGAIIQQWQTNSNTNVQRMEQLYDSMISKIVQLTTSIFDMLKQSMDAMQQAATIR
jgi:hypothetical protein